jgi:hypothetical protein
VRFLSTLGELYEWACIILPCQHCGVPVRSQRWFEQGIRHGGTEAALERLLGRVRAWQGERVACERCPERLARAS